MRFHGAPQGATLSVLLGRALAQSEPSEVPNPAVDILSCQDLSCEASGDSICASGDSAGPEIGIGIAAEAVEVGSTSLSLTLINGLDANGFTGIGSDNYEHWDQQLFVGLPSSLDDDEFPSGCALMMQYLGQTFPKEDLPDEDARSDGAEGTTSCDGVIDPFCQSAIAEMVRSSNASEGSGSDRCNRLVEDISNQLTQSSGTCGGEGTWIANFINITGGPLPGPDSSTPRNDQLGGDCQPVMPQEYELYHVANMTQFLFSDAPGSGSDFYGEIFGGRSGFTPVVSVVYDEDDDAEVQFSCMQTFERNGDAHENQFGSAAAVVSRTPMAVMISALIAGVAAAM